MQPSQAPLWGALTAGSTALDAQDLLAAFLHAQVQTQLSLLLLECVLVNCGLSEWWLAHLLSAGTYNISLHFLKNGLETSKNGFGQTN